MTPGQSSTLLPPQERAALALKDLFGFTLAEVADVLIIRIVRDGKSAVNDLMRLTTENGRVRSIRWYYFSPDFLTEAAAELGEPVELNGHHY